MEYKQAILIRTDLGMSRGKMCAQVAHAALEAARKVRKKDEVLKREISKKWREQGMKKVVLKVRSKPKLFHYKDLAERSSISTSVVKDAGKTEIPGGSYTALGIGPDEAKKINKISGELKTL